MMEQDILTQLYFGKITPWEKRSGTDPEMDALRDRIDAEAKALESMLPQEGGKLLAQLLRLGAKLTAAVFYGDKTA